MNRRYLFVIITLLILSLFSVAYAEDSGDSGESVTVPVNMLTPEQRAQIQAQQVQQKIDQYGFWGGFGEEVGTAFNSALSSLTKTASQFANTKLGTYILFLVAYKVLGSDAIQLLVGVPLFIFMLIVWWFSYRKCFPKRFVIKKTGFLWWGEKEYSLTDPDNYTNYDISIVKMAHFFVLLGIVIVCGMVIFM
jgi:hypothetical protein